MKLGIVGLPNVGKSTLFNAMTNARAAAANYPFCTIDPNIGVVPVPDARLAVLADMYKPKKVTPATVEFVDIAGLVRGASKGEGLGNRFLSHIREVDGIVHVVRCFRDTDIAHVDGEPDPVRDIGTIETELILSDLELVERRLDKEKKLAKGDKKHAVIAEQMEALYAHLNNGGTAASFDAEDAVRAVIDEMPLLSNKKVIFAANLDETELAGSYMENPMFQAVAAHAASVGAVALPVSAKIESEINEMEPEDRRIFLDELGIAESGLDRLIRASYALLGLISFLTAGEPEVRAWTIREGTKAPGAAGVIHSDFERGFIRAEVTAYDKLVAAGSPAAAKEKGYVRGEGKDYVMRDGDVVLFRFNV